MPELNIQPDVISCNATLSSLGPQWQLAVHFLGMMDHSYGVQPDVISFNTTMSSCEKANEWQQALAVFQAILSDARQGIWLCNL